MTWGDRILIVVTVVAVPLILIGVPIYLLCGGLRSFALRPLQRCFEGLDIHEHPRPGDVTFVYHTYRGFLLWSTQDEFRVAAPPAEAELLLSRLLRFNLTWGLLSYGTLVIPLLALGNYYAQRQSIRSQTEDMLKR